jgi:uncharacterized membrane protein YfcA
MDRSIYRERDYFCYFKGIGVLFHDKAIQVKNRKKYRVSQEDSLIALEGLIVGGVTGFVGAGGGFSVGTSIMMHRRCSISALY